MGEFTGVVLGFPTVLFGGALLVVVAYWGLVLVGGADAHGPGHHGHVASHDASGVHHAAVHHAPAHDAHAPHAAALHAPSHDVPAHDAAAHPGSGTESGQDAHGGGSRGSLIAAAGLDGVPVTVVVSLLVTFAWCLSLVGSTALNGAGVHGAPRAAADLALLAAALVGSWSLTWLAVRPLRHLFPEQRPPSREDFVGQLCVVRTGSVTRRFGQAEVTSPDGSTAVVQVRQDGDDAFAAGSTALLYAYEPQGEFFWVAPFDDPLGTPPTGPLDGPAVT
ncbi:MAG: hypothetical protein FWE15_31000 [Actinomycetia bacterium]|nr:hypothetical protein [Actinomycetes bacterium]MCL2734428.1 hypothetical protein [Actinomycetes bacterium]